MKWLARLSRSRASEAQSAARTLDQATLHQLEQAGANRAKATDIVSYLFTPTEPPERAAAAELEQAGYSVEVRPAATGSQWLALTTIQLAPTEENIAVMRNRFERSGWTLRR